jgi:hypothetical protein
MPNRFEIFISRIETTSAGGRAGSNSPGHQDGARSNKTNAKPVRADQALSEKDRAKHARKNAG